VTGTAWKHQREVREALQTIASGPQLGAAVPRTPGEWADKEELARTLRHPPAGPAPAPLDDSIL
jgi:hypothetical protein